MTEFKPLNLAQLYQAADASVAQAMQTNLLVLQASAMKRDYDEQEGMKSLLGRYDTSDATQRPTFLREAMRVSPQSARQYQQQFAAEDRANADAKAKDRDAFLAFAKQSRDMLASVEDDAGLSQYADVVRATAQTFRTPEIRDLVLKEAQTIPTKFDPKWKENELTTVESFLAKRQPQSQVAKLKADFDAGRIDRETYEAAVAKATKDGPQTVVNVGQEKPPAGYRWAADGQSLEPIPGGPATQIAGEVAGKKALAEQGARAVKDARATFIDKDGKVDRTAIGTAMSNVPTSKGRSARQQVRLAIEGALRLATGAAAPEPEVTRYENMFLPTIADSDDDVKRKLDTLEDFLTNTSKYIGRGKEAPAKEGPKLPEGFKVLRVEKK